MFLEHSGMSEEKPKLLHRGDKPAWRREALVALGVLAVCVLVGLLYWAATQ